MNNTLSLTKALIACESVTPSDGGAHAIISELLIAAGFTVEALDKNEVKNLWATHGKTGPLFVFAGHTDVVPTGDLNLWQTPPFEAIEKDGKLFGRGACDMKAAVAAMVIAAIEFVNTQPDHPGRIGIMLTSDEEGAAQYGTRHIVETLKTRGEKIDYCIIGEPSSSKTLGDTIKVGRRGSLHVDITIHGQSGHVAYPDTVKNPAHLSAAFIQALTDTLWDEQPLAPFPPTSVQITSLESKSTAGNTTPERLTLHANWRYSPATSAEAIQAKVESLLNTSRLKYDIDWQISAKPFLSAANSAFQDSVCKVIEKHTANMPERSTSGGTSDGRFIIDICDDLLELGMINQTIHQINEHIPLEDINLLKMIYMSILDSEF